MSLIDIAVLLIQSAPAGHSFMPKKEKVGDFREAYSNPGFRSSSDAVV